MAGVGTLSVNQTPEYGDKAALDKLKSGMTETPMTGNPTPAPTAGRPVTTGAGSESMVDPTTGQPVQVPLGHQEAARDVAAKAWAAREWAIMAQSPTAGPRVRLYAEAAQKALEAAMSGTRAQTPFFE